MSDRVTELPGLEQRIDDLRAVMDAVGMEQAALLGMSEGGSMMALFAATYPERCNALVLYGSFTRFTSWLPTEEALAGFLGYIDQAWGSGGTVSFLHPRLRMTRRLQQWQGRFERLGASPAAATALMRMNSQIDISDIVPNIRVPTLVIHRNDDAGINVEGGRYLAEHIPGARYIELPGKDHLPWVGDNAMEIADAIEEFLTGARAPVPVDRVLATVLFTDIVGSTEKAAALGDRRGAIFSTSITLRSGATWLAFAAMRSKRPATAFLPPLTARPAVFAAPARLPRKSGRSASKFAPDCILASAK